MTFLLDTPTQLELPISPDLATQSWQQSQSQPTVLGQWQQYLNQICYQTFLPWLETEQQSPARVSLNQTLLPSLWSVVNGTAITWGEKRLILVPDKSMDISEFRVPQEWVDIPELVGDYYLAVQINPEELSMGVWGYTTHQQLKTTGSYNSSDKSYSIDAQEMISDLTVLWVVNQLNSAEVTRVPVANFSPVTATQAENLLSRLANPEIIQPRLELPLSLWAGIITNDNWRANLYQMRQRGFVNPSLGNFAPAKVAANLSQWLQNSFEESWQSLENLLGNNTNLAFNLRQPTEQEDTTIRRVKSLNLPQGEAFLILGLDTETDGRIGIRIQLRTLNQELSLPSHLSLKLLSSTGEMIQSVESREQDNMIQIKRFKIRPGTQFSVQIQVDSFVVTEDFVV
ncbi:DUF1822 family protein [Calothrix sp. 336/3]|uniref:DUF1822 family protein n=1 Tax=Calothrix sp. 336/3 TaxID=1337936 RepID=UPI0004E337D8|nr:DUF1822 family protein [Calothrix sp. 336/3]AKG20883.1 hypothetical protein IJ00_05820 [Calothrix sp. 336/3]